MQGVYREIYSAAKLPNRDELIAYTEPLHKVAAATFVAETNTSIPKIYCFAKSVLNAVGKEYVYEQRFVW